MDRDNLLWHIRYRGIDQRFLSETNEFLASKENKSPFRLISVSQSTNEARKLEIGVVSETNQIKWTWEIDYSREPFSVIPKNKFE